MTTQGGEPAELSTVGRGAALLALLAAAVLAGLILLGGGDGYTVKARFQAVSTAVEGGLVQVSGRRAGTIEAVRLTDDGQAELELKVDERYAPLRTGTQAVLRVRSLSGSASRYVDLRIPPSGGQPIPEGGVIGVGETSTEADIDQFFAMFDERTREGLQKVIRGFADQYGGKGAEANLGWRYLNPSFVAATRVFNELNRDTPILEDFLVASSRLVTDVAERRDDLAALVDGLADTTGALAREERDLSTAIDRLPPFLRRANTTFVNLRATLDDLDPLLAESAEVTPRLRAVLGELAPFALEARPTVRDLANTVRRDGRDNDLLELARRTPALRDIAIGPVRRNGAQREGSLPAGTKSLEGQAPHFGFFRSYAVELTGWFDDFSHSGIIDANGSASRVATSVNAFAGLDGQLRPVPPELRDELTDAVTRRGQNNRCPGSVERTAPDGSNPWKPDNVNCDPTQVPPGS